MAEPHRREGLGRLGAGALAVLPSVIDPRYATPLEMHDPGEPENNGAILMARYGKGTYVYTTLSLFRQFPAGVPGSARLFVNLLSAGRAPVARPAPRVQP